jgi:putative protein kinase ArgK-like GTPase of G3E family
MAETRRKLPAFEKRTEVLQLMSSNRAVVVTGETGCGKTTQVPQYLYEQDCTRKILICQPRRLAAVGVATRVAEEVGCALGEQVRVTSLHAQIKHFVYLRAMDIAGVHDSQQILSIHSLPHIRNVRTAPLFAWHRWATW